MFYIVCCLYVFLFYSKKYRTGPYLLAAKLFRAAQYVVSSIVSIIIFCSIFDYFFDFSYFLFKFISNLVLNEYLTVNF